MDTLTTIFERRSYRGFYTSDSVPRSDLEIILKAGLAAPSGCNKQTTSLIAVDDPAVLAEVCRYMDIPAFASAPAVICVLTQRICAYRDKCFSVQDYSAAIQNMLLAIEDLGYRSCWVEGHITDADNIGRKMADVLGVPADYDLVCFMPVGRARDAVSCPKKRNMNERAWFNHFGLQ